MHRPRAEVQSPRAYLYAFASALAKAGRSAGLEPPVAFRIATQTLIGATALLAKSDRTLEQLVAEVAGEGGSTRAALDVLENGGLDSLLANGVKAAVARAQERNGESEAASWATPAST